MEILKFCGITVGLSICFLLIAYIYILIQSRFNFKDAWEDIKYFFTYYTNFAVVFVIIAMYMAFFTTKLWKSHPEAFNILFIAPWIVTFFRSMSENPSQFNRLFPNRKTVATIMETLQIKTFNYDDFRHKYIDFIRLKTLPKESTSELDYSSNLVYFAFTDRDFEHHEIEYLVQSISVKRFCALYELHNRSFSSSDIDDLHYIKIAAVWYGDAILTYPAKYAAEHQKKDGFTQLAYFIESCYKHRLDPTYKDYLEFALKHQY